MAIKSATIAGMFIEIDGKKVHVERQGKGDPLLLVHGWGGTVESLRMLADLAQEQCETIIIDLPGFGSSDNPDTNWGVEEYSTLVVKLIEKLQLKNLTYFGHSFGGGLGIYISSKYPDVIRTLILCNSAFKRSNKQSRLVKFLKQYIYPYLPFVHTFETKLRYYIYRLFFPQSDLVKYPHLEPNFRKVMTQDLTEYASRIKIPTLIVWGEEDTYTPVSFAYELKEKITHSQLVVFPNQRHNLPLKHPELVWKELKKFMNTQL